MHPQKIEAMIVHAFEQRMKDNEFHMSYFPRLRALVLLCIDRYSANSIHFPAFELEALLMNDIASVSYFQAGVLLQLAKGAPLSTFADNIFEQIKTYYFLEELTTLIESVSIPFSQAAEREVTTRLKLMQK